MTERVKQRLEYFRSREYRSLRNTDAATDMPRVPIKYCGELVLHYYPLLVLGNILYNILYDREGRHLTLKVVRLNADKRLRLTYAVYRDGLADNLYPLSLDKTPYIKGMVVHTAKAVEAYSVFA